MKRDLICIICPRGCSLQAQMTADGVAVTGNGCPKGQEYAAGECTNPVRTVTATVRVSNRQNTMAAVKTATPVAKSVMLELMQVLRKTTVQAPVHIGDIILTDVFGADIIVTQDIA